MKFIEINSISQTVYDIKNTLMEEHLNWEKVDYLVLKILDHYWYYYINHLNHFIVIYLSMA